VTSPNPQPQTLRPFLASADRLFILTEPLPASQTDPDPVPVLGLDPGWSDDMAIVYGEIHNRRALCIRYANSTPRLTIAAALRLPVAAGYMAPAVIAADPCVHAHSWQTGLTDAEVLQHLGYAVRTRREPRAARLNRLRFLLHNAPPTYQLRIDAAAEPLLDAVRTHRAYVSADEAQQDPSCPYRHLIDALSYLAAYLIRADLD